jgi:hypothetical protein
MNAISQNFWMTVAVFLLAYPMMWVLSFDPNFRLRVFFGDKLESPNELSIDERPSLLSAGAIFWTGCVAVLFAQPSGQCNIHPSAYSATELVLAALTIAICGKCLFGAVGENHKRVILDDGRRLSRPVSWRLLDLITPIPGNLGINLVSKLFWYPIFMLIVWLLDRALPRTVNFGFVVPEFIFFTSIFIFMGRLATIYTSRNRKPYHAAAMIPFKPHLRGGILILTLFACLVSFVVTYVVMEALLKKCGARPNELPSFTTLLTGLLTIPLFNLLSAVVGIILVRVAVLRS